MNEMAAYALNIALIILTIASSAVSFYLDTKAKLRSQVVDLIDSAEDVYSGERKAGVKKYDWVVDQLYELVPMPLRPVFSWHFLGSLVNSIEHYAVLQKAKKQSDAASR